MDLTHDLSFIDRIEHLFARHGGSLYDGARAEPVTALAHALQCAQLAEWAHADASLVAAALLHDVGHFLQLDIDLDADEATDDRHEEAAVPFLAQAFDASVTEPVRLHVAAKRYLVRVDARYADTLSPASVHSLALQGGPMGDDELNHFESLPFAMDSVQLRRWDDLAKVPGKRTPPLSYYLALLEELQMRPVDFAKTGIGATDMS
jgi:phosphonate degradation associated HDIG domain protein